MDMDIDYSKLEAKSSFSCKDTPEFKFWVSKFSEDIDKMYEDLQVGPESAWEILNEVIRMSMEKKSSIVSECFTAIEENDETFKSLDLPGKLK